MGMGLYWIPSRISNFDFDVRLLTKPWRGLVKAARLHDSFLRLKQQRFFICQHCGIEESESVHHIVPLWVLSAETIASHVLSFPAGVSHDQYSIRCFLIFREKDTLFPLWNAAENCVSLCRSCHEKAETRAYAYFKNALMKKWAPLLHWDYNSAEKAFTQINKRGGYLA